MDALSIPQLLLNLWRELVVKTVLRHCLLGHSLQVNMSNRTGIHGCGQGFASPPTITSSHIPLINIGEFRYAGNHARSLLLACLLLNLCPMQLLSLPYFPAGGSGQNPFASMAIRRCRVRCEQRGILVPPEPPPRFNSVPDAELPWPKANAPGPNTSAALPVRLRQGKVPIPIAAWRISFGA